MKKRPDYAASVADTINENVSTETLTKRPAKSSPVKAPEAMPRTESSDAATKSPSPAPAKKSSTAGRPRGIPKKQYSIYIPEEMVPDMAGPLQYYQGDISKYITKLISDDLNRNKEAYMQLMNITIK